MAKTVRIIKKPLRHFSGFFQPPSTILLKEGLTPQQEAETLEHELKHFRFYHKYWLLKPFLYSRFMLFYSFLLLLALHLSPIFFLVMWLPALVSPLHEIHVSAHDGSWNGVFETLLGIFVFPLLLLLRWLIPWVILMFPFPVWALLMGFATFLALIVSHWRKQKYGLTLEKR